MAQVTGLGGIFFKVKDVDATNSWYREMLGLHGQYGIIFRFGDDSADGYSVFSPFKADSDYFAPSEAPFMINLRVDDLDAVLAALKAKGIEPLGRQDEDYGSFAWILDPNGIKIELWQQRGPAPPA